MKKTVLAATVVAIALCFSLSVNAASVFTVSVDSINSSETDNKNIIYTRDFGETVPEAEGDYYVITVIPKITNSDTSVEESSEEISSTTSDTTEIPQSSSDSTEESSTLSDVLSDDSIISSDITSEISNVIPEIISSSDATETASVGSYKYKIENVYSPSDVKRNISIPENGFAVIFRSENNTVTSEISEISDSVTTSETSDSSVETRNVSASDIEAGAPVAVYGVNFETLSVSEGAYIEIDLSGKGLLGDIPQTSDNNMTAIFTVVASLSVLSAAWFCRKKCSV